MTKETQITIGKWKNQPVEELSKKELLEVIAFLSDQLDDEKDLIHGDMKLYTDGQRILFTDHDKLCTMKMI